jgi:hypothetical protein
MGVAVGKGTVGGIQRQLAVRWPRIHTSVGISPQTVVHAEMSMGTPARAAKGPLVDESASTCSAAASSASVGCDKTTPLAAPMCHRVPLGLNLVASWAPAVMRRGRLADEGAPAGSASGGSSRRPRLRPTPVVYAPSSSSSHSPAAASTTATDAPAVDAAASMADTRPRVVHPSVRSTGGGAAAAAAAATAARATMVNSGRLVKGVIAASATPAALATSRTTRCSVLRMRETSLSWTPRRE